MNVVVIRVDQGRKRALQVYDPISPCATPAITALASDSQIYLNAITTEPKCSSHRTSFDTGKHSHALPNIDKLDVGDRTVQGLLDAAGVYCFAVGKWHKTPPALQTPNGRVPSSILRGFSYFAGHEVSHDLVGGPYWILGTQGTQNAGPWRPQTHVELFLSQLASAPWPFYGVLDLEPPHTPYQDIISTQWDTFDPNAMVPDPNVPAGLHAQVKQDLAHYYGMLSSVDAMVAQVLDYLGTHGFLDETVVIFTADHGAHIGAHGLSEVNEQKCTIYREALEVPLFIRVPGVAGAYVHEPWGTMAFCPYILDLFGVDHGPGLHHGKEPEGLYIETFDPDGAPDGPWRGILLNGWRYARSEGSGPWLMFDPDDEWDETNLVGHNSPMEPVLDAALFAAAEALGDTIPW